MKNTTEVCLAAGGVKPPKSLIRLCHHGFASANIVTAPMNSTEMLKIIQKEYPSVQSTHGTKVSIGTAMKELGFEHKEHSHVAYYKVVPLHTA